VQPWRPFAQQFLALERRIFDPEPDDLFIITARFQAADDDRGQIRAAQRHEPLDL
jgi:hypothetical protein